MLSTRTGKPGLERLISRNTSRPLRPGMVMSSTTTSHLSFQARLRASWALRASPNSARRSPSARMWRRPLRTTAWSSTRRIFMGDLGADEHLGTGSDYDIEPPLRGGAAGGGGLCEEGEREAEGDEDD